MYNVKERQSKGLAQVTLDQELLNAQLGLSATQALCSTLDRLLSPEMSLRHDMTLKPKNE